MTLPRVRCRCRRSAAAGDDANVIKRFQSQLTMARFKCYLSLLVDLDGLITYQCDQIERFLKVPANNKFSSKSSPNTL